LHFPLSHGNKVKKLILILVGVAIAGLNTSSYSGESIEGQENSTYQQIEVWFLPGTLELTIHDLDGLIRKLDRTASYQIQGYACNDDKGSEEELLSAAERRANTVRNILIQRGFSASKLSTTAYDKDNDCKAVIFETEK
jgi:outer membrane protein OmpA-like peptidoglycan-associated protein